MKANLDHLYDQITNTGAQCLVGWLLEAAKTSPRIERELRSFRAWKEKQAANQNGLPAFRDLSPRGPAEA